MTGPGTFALFGVVAIATQLAAPDRQARLSVTATVVRPAEISTAVTRPGVALVTIGNSPGINVLPEPDIVRQADGNILVTVPRRTRSITITVTY